MEIGYKNKHQSGQGISHFNQKDHSIKNDFRMTAMEKVYGSTDILRLRERMYIDYFELIEHGLNTKRT